ncbi:STAS domain-containing protein [Alkalibacter saccharofermentans]|uniref:Anti-sigma factor antagonist n=1 Tax=Alkalibacter saccharofermentans DSM 14828 TaxID=1120975 RepID=A0A1M5A0M7_9FIRM|nr:STAS domain-containing protein [Alkalibacter saccharofermentans]SHF23825.1 anti-sigma B factor antagonist [Alkalibacter saccharofermentans DSM 14828]
MLSISINNEKDRLEVALIGEVDIYTVDMLKNKMDEVNEIKGKEIVFDLERLDYIDSTGLGALIGVKGKHPDAVIKVINMKSNVSRLFDITGLSKIFVTE